MALVLSRKKGEAIRIGPSITITLGETRGSYTEILIDAPRSVPVWRAEIQNFHAGGDSGDDICGGGVSARTDDSASNAVSVDTEYRAQDQSDNRRKARGRRGRGC